MEKQEPRFLGAAEVVDRLGACRTKAYKSFENSTTGWRYEAARLLPAA